MRHEINHTTDLHLCQTIAQWLRKGYQPPLWSTEQWARFQHVSRVHGVAPLLYATIGKQSWLPLTTRSWLVRQYAANHQRIRLMLTELSHIQQTFADASIPLLPLKGAIVAQQFYEQPAQRPMADLDLLVRPVDKAQSCALLLHLGYQRTIEHWKHTEFIKPDNQQVVDPQTEHPHNPRKVELHLHCRESFGGIEVDLSALMWANQADGGLLALWLHLLAHASYHFWQGKGRLIQLCDLARVQANVMAQVGVAGGQAYLAQVDGRFTYPALSLTQRTFPCPAGEALLAQTRNHVSHNFRTWADGLDLVNGSHLNPKPAGLYTLKAIRFSEGRPDELLRVARFALLPSLDELALDHPGVVNSPLPWLAYGLLPFDWLKRLRPTA